jgi:DNA-binding NarL/FixJ family response regulator
MCKKGKARIPSNSGSNTRSQATCETCQDLPESAKKGPSKIPLPQQERIRQKFITGVPMHQIAREEGIARETVERTVKSDEMKLFVSNMRE